MVEYDSIIPPGREGVITPQVKVKNMTHSFNKTIQVQSNASNEPNLSLHIRAKVAPIIEVSTSFVTLRGGSTLEKSPKVTLKTKKKDLKISEVVFKSTAKKQPGLFSGGSVPITVRQSLSRTDKPAKDGTYTYELKLAVDTKVSQTEKGRLEISTNHPKRPKLDIRTSIVAR